MQKTLLIGYLGQRPGNEVHRWWHRDRHLHHRLHRASRFLTCKQGLMGRHTTSVVSSSNPWRWEATRAR